MLVNECSQCGRIKVCGIKVDYESRKLLRQVKSNETLFNLLDIDWIEDSCSECKKRCSRVKK